MTIEVRQNGIHRTVRINCLVGKFPFANMKLNTSRRRVYNYISVFRTFDTIPTGTVCKNWKNVIAQELIQQFSLQRRYDTRSIAFTVGAPTPFTLYHMCTYRIHIIRYSDLCLLFSHYIASIQNSKNLVFFSVCNQILPERGAHLC